MLGASIHSSVLSSPKTWPGLYVVTVPYLNLQPSQIGPGSVLGLRAETLPWASVDNEGALWCALECCLSTSYSWIPAAGGEGADHLRSGLTACLLGVGMEGLGRVKSTCKVHLEKSPNMALVARDSNISATHSR